MPEQQAMAIDQPPDLTEQIMELERELAKRREVYPRWIAQDKIKLQTANYRVETMKAAIESLRRLEQMQTATKAEA